MRSLLAAAALVTLTAAGCHGPWHRGGHDFADVDEHATKGVVRALDRLDGTDEQKRQVLVVKDEVLVTAKPLIESRDATKAAVKAEWAAATPDAAKLHALADARGAEINAVLHKLADAFVKVHGILTPEQREKVSARFAR